MNRSPVTPLFTVFSSCHIVKLGNKSHGHLSTLGIRFALSFSLCSVACLKLSIKSHSHVSIVGICLANATRLCSQNLGLRLGLLLCLCQSCFQSRSQSRFLLP